MLQALINATLIWLSSLLVYELLLKKTTFHRLNRGYMLLTFLAGIVLPLLPWQAPVEINTLSQAGAQALSDGTKAAATSGTANATIPPPTGFSPDWLQILYLTGAAITVLFLLRDLWRIRRLYRHAEITREGRWIIAETGAAHSPFSFLNIIFVSERAEYSGHQWRMLTSHEKQHFRNGHLLDLLLLHAALILLWFHPLVYFYRARLRLIHEYEVDAMQESDTLSYGRFLLEQAACKPLAMTHALNFSPLKSRIKMMTKNASSRGARARFLLLLPIMSCALWCCAKNQEKVAIDIKDRNAMRQDAKVSFPPNRTADTVIMIDPVTGKEEQMIMTIEPRPEKLNGIPIVNRTDLKKAPQCRNPGPDFGIRYLVDRSEISPILEKLPDGKYNFAIWDLIVDTKGRVAYFSITLPENHSALTPGPGGTNIAKSNMLSDPEKADIQKKIAQALIGDEVLFTTAIAPNGEAVPYFLGSEEKERAFQLSTEVVVKDHRISFED